MNWKQADIPLLASPQGGVAERSGKYCEASADREARVVFRMNPMETTPAASASVASRNFFDDAATPPCGDARRGMAFHLYRPIPKTHRDRCCNWRSTAGCPGHRAFPRIAERIRVSLCHRADPYRAFRCCKAYEISDVEHPAEQVRVPAPRVSDNFAGLPVLPGRADSLPCGNRPP